MASRLIGRTLFTESGQQFTVERLLGSGGQGEVYQVRVEDQLMALKWYFPQYIASDSGLRKRLEDAIRKGAPTDRFLWPLELVEDPEKRTFGYLMPLRDPRFKSIAGMMRRHIEPSFRALCTAGFELAHNFLELHSKGLCYRDISHGNVFLDPDTGEICICDNDNVDVTGKADGGVFGTPRFMAPEIVRGEAYPSTETDLFSLAVLLFYMFFLHHPLEGRKEAEIHCFDLPAMKKLYGLEPVFIFDPQDNSNRPVPGLHDNAIIYWEIYPEFLRELFTRAFTDGLRDPEGRVRESEWRKAFVKLRDSIIYCSKCGAENFYDAEKLREGRSHLCWACNSEIRLPPRIRIGEAVVMLNHDTKLFPHHLGGELYNFDVPIAEVAQHPKQPDVWGLRNLSQDTWTVTRQDGTVLQVCPGKSLTITLGVEINFGRAKGEIRL